MGSNQLKVIFSPEGGLWLLCCSELCQAEELVTILMKMVIMVMVGKMIDIAKMIKMTIMLLLIDCEEMILMLLHLDRVSWEDLWGEEAGPHRDSSPLEPELQKIIICFFQDN